MSIGADYYNRYYEIGILHSITANGIIYHLSVIFARHGIPKLLLGENGTQFVSKYLSDWGNVLSIRVSHMAPYWPQANSEVERKNKGLVKILKIAHAEKGDWSERLNDFLLIYSSTLCSTEEAMCGRN